MMYGGPRNARGPLANTPLPLPASAAGPATRGARWRFRGPPRAPLRAQKDRGYARFRQEERRFSSKKRGVCMVGRDLMRPEAVEPGRYLRKTPGRQPALRWFRQPGTFRVCHDRTHPPIFCPRADDWCRVPKAGARAELYAWCLMGNHVHLLFHAPIDCVSACMKKTCGSYARNFNDKSGRVGHLFQERFKSEPI